MPDEKTKQNPTKKLQELLKKRDTKVIVTKQCKSNYDARRNRSSGFTAEAYSSYDEE